MTAFVIYLQVTKMKMISPSNREVDVGRTLSETEYIGMCRREVCAHEQPSNIWGVNINGYQLIFRL